MCSLILQAFITVFGILAIGLLSLKHKIRRYGFVCGLISDMFWVWWVLLTANYIFLVFTFVRIICYLNGKCVLKENQLDFIMENSYENT